MKLNRRTFLLASTICGSSLAAGSALGGFNFQFPYSSKNGRQSLLIGGSAAMFDLNTAMKTVFEKLHANVDIVVEKGGSLPGLIAVRRGAIDIAAMARELSEEEDEPAMRNFLIARSCILIIVHKSLAIQTLTQQQIHDIFVGKIDNWKALGGPDASINVISRTHASTTRQFVEDVVLSGAEIVTGAKELNTTKSLADAVASDRYAIGYIASKDQAGNAEFNTLRVDQIAASRATIYSGRYPYTHSFYLLLYGEKSKLAQSFVNFARSQAGQKIVIENGLLAVC
jgi:phosphate transport system substrate-binding protein